MKVLLAAVVGLLTMAAITSCVWLDPTELSCTTLGHESCPPDYHCGEMAEGSEERSCVAGAAPIGDDDTAGDDDVGPDDDDTVGPDDDDSGGDDDDSGGDDDDSGGDDAPPYTWEQWDASEFGPPGGGRPALRAVSFPSETHGWVVGDAGTILHSDDAGATWQFQNQDASVPPQANFQGPLLGVHFVDQITGVAVSGSAAILWTTNGGDLWNTATNFASDLEFNAVWAAPGGLFHVAGVDGDGDGVIYRQLAAGDLSEWHWIYETLGDEDYGLNSISGWPGGSPADIVAAGNNGTVVRLSDQNDPVSRHDLGGNLFGLAVIDASQAWAVGAEGLVQKTQTGGVKWDQVHIGGNWDRNDVAFTGERFGWIGGRGGRVFRTSDYGNNWYQDPMPAEVNANSLPIYDLEFQEPDLGWAVGNQGLILRTVAGGATGDDDTSGDDDDTSGDDDDTGCTDGDLDGAIDDSCPGGTDCDDTDPSVHPGAPESCDTTDRNCDGDPTAGAADAATYYLDLDGDGVGDQNSPTTACSAPSGYVSSGDDCDDADPSTYPLAPELCDGLDNNCDTSVPTDEIDGDGDGYVVCAPWLGSTTITAGGDCDDTNGFVVPGGTEYCDGLDSDCDGDTDEGCPTANDSDGDGAVDSVDCAPQDPAIFPGAWDGPGGADTDCDGDPSSTGAEESALGFAPQCGTQHGGFAISTGGGDFNGDGTTELAFGAPGWNTSCAAPPSAASGRGYLWTNPGTSSLPLVGSARALDNDVTNGNAHGFEGLLDSETGYSIALGGNVNGDAYDDLLIGAPGRDLDPSNTSNGEHGAVYLKLGWSVAASACTVSGFGCVDFTFYGAGSHHYTGVTVAWVGDLTGDNKDEILIGAPGHGGETGIVYLIDGSFSRTASCSLDGGATTLSNCMNLASLTSPHASIAGTTGQDKIGGTPAAFGDISGDGRPDIVLGSSAINSGRGAAYVFFSEALAPVSGTSATITFGNNTVLGASRTLHGSVASGGLGTSATFIENFLNPSDSLPELALGAPNTGGGDGAVYIVASDILNGASAGVAMQIPGGGAGGSINNVARSIVGKSGSTEGLGSALASADVDGDGKGDLVACAPMGFETSTNPPTPLPGSARLYLGSRLGDLTQASPLGTSEVDFEFHGQSVPPPEPPVEFCSSVGFPGDIDGDTVVDLLIGAPDWGDGKGKAYLFINPFPPPTP